MSDRLSYSGPGIVDPKRKRGGPRRLPIYETGDPWCDLLAAVARQALKDAVGTKPAASARLFLDEFMPEWKRWLP